jgi:dihydroorotase
MKYLIKNGRVVDPANKIDDVADILISDGVIEKIAKSISEKADKVIEAKDRIVAPGLIDMHVHLREPGREDEETITTGTAAAVAGGFTTVLSMPNTDPAIDDPKTVKALSEKIKKEALANVLICGAITERREGKKLVDMKALKKEGVVALSDDGASLEDKNVIFEALKAVKTEGLVLIEHCEDIKMSAGGVMNKGFISTKMGLKGIPRQAEYERVKRNIEIAKKASSSIHIAHVSLMETIDIIRKAKKAGVRVTCETTPHHFSLTDECCVTYDTNTKMNPPLRTKDDVEAVKKGLSDGTIDAIATDHAPHTDSEKDVEFDYAPFGIIGLETALGLAVTELIEKSVLTWPELILKMSANPAFILGITGGALKKESPADIVIIDPAKRWVYERESIRSKSRNSPFIGWTLKGQAETVFVRGRLVMKDGTIMG